MKGARRVPDLVLERYRLGELSPAEANAVRLAIEEDAALRERVAALDASDREILAARPAAAFAAELARGPAALVGAVVREPARPFWLLKLVPATAIVAVVVAANGLLLQAPETPARVADGDRLKGGSPALMLFRKAEATVERLASGAVAHASDVVQIVYQSGGRRYGVILSIDGRGIVTRHLPSRGDQAAPLSTEGVTPLEAAYRLDDAPRLERFFFIVADAPFSVPAVVEAVRNPRFDPLTGDRLPLDQPFVQASFLLRKE